MRKQRTLNRMALARRLQELALSIAAGKPVRVGNVSVLVPEQVVLEEELETKEGETELEFELKWATELGPATSTKKKATKPTRARKSARGAK
jgi:amphi-Trp domain-containing protein